MASKLKGEEQTTKNYELTKIYCMYVYIGNDQDTMLRQRFDHDDIGKFHFSFYALLHPHPAIHPSTTLTQHRNTQLYSIQYQFNQYPNDNMKSYRRTKDILNNVYYSISSYFFTFIFTGLTGKERTISDSVLYDASQFSL